MTFTGQFEPDTIADKKNVTRNFGSSVILLNQLCESDFKTSSALQAVLSPYHFFNALQDRGFPLTIGSCALKRFQTDFSWLKNLARSFRMDHFQSTYHQKNF